MPRLPRTADVAFLRDLTRYDWLDTPTGQRLPRAGLVHLASDPLVVVWVHGEPLSSRRDGQPTEAA